jgi:hypothetical protein
MRQKTANSRQESASVLAIIFACAAASLTLTAGCTRTVLVTEDAPMRTGPKIAGRMYTMDGKGDWILSDNQVAIPEGWYVVPPSFVKEQ